MDPQKLNNIVLGGFNSEDNVKHFLSELQLFRENINDQKFKVIKFYRDWMLHLDKGNIKEMYLYFNSLNELLNKYDNLPDRRKLNNLVQSFTSFIDLRDQLKTLLRKYAVESQFVEDDEKWSRFCYFLRLLIIKKPILFKQLKESAPRRKIELFVMDERAPVMTKIDDAIYWMLYIDTSEEPLVGIVPESVCL